jgi:glycosyltransferase 2 family protein
VRRWLNILIALVVSVVCVWLAMRHVSLSEMLRVLRSANYFGFIGSMALTILGFWVRAERWRSLIAVPRRISTDSLFSCTMIGFMANMVLPLRLGEFVRPWALARREGLSNTMLLATIVVERAVDMLTLLTLLGVALFVHPISTQSAAARLLQKGALLLVMLSVVLTVFIVLLERSPKLAHRVIELLTRPLPARARGRVQRLLDRFIEGLGLFRDLRRLSWVFALSFGMFLIYAFAIWVSLWSLDILLGWDVALLMLVVTAIGIMVPSAPGYVGPLNAACVAGLALFKVPSEPAAAFSWFWLASQWLPITVVGLFYLNREGLSLGALGQATEDPR